MEYIDLEPHAELAHEIYDRLEASTAGPSEAMIVLATVRMIIVDLARHGMAPDDYHAFVAWLVGLDETTRTLPARRLVALMKQAKS